MDDFRIALLLVGMLRRFDDLYPNLKEYVLDPLSPDVFFSGYPNERGLYYCENKIKELWNPKKYFITNYDENFKKRICSDESKYYLNKRPETNVSNSLSFLWNLKNVNNLRKQYEFDYKVKYDVLYFIRTDLVHHGTPTKEQIRLAKSGKILIPEKWDFWEVHPESMSNQCALSDPDSMEKYCLQFDKLDQYINDGIIFHPETLTGVHVNRMKLDRVKVGKRETGEKFECPWFDFDYLRK